MADFPEKPRGSNAQGHALPIACAPPRPSGSSANFAFAPDDEHQIVTAQVVAAGADDALIRAARLQPHVMLMGQRMKMRPSNARRIFAGMMQLFVGRNVALENLVPDHSALPQASAHGEVSVSQRHFRPRPDPASTHALSTGRIRPILVDFFPESLDSIVAVGRHDATNYSVKGGANPAYGRLSRETGKPGLTRADQPAASCG